MKTTKKIILPIVHLSFFAVTVIMTLHGVLNGAAAGQVGSHMINIGFFKAFTVDSNDLAIIFSISMTFILIRSNIKKDAHIPYWATVLQFLGSTSLFLTFLATADFLAPNQVDQGTSNFLYFSDGMFFLLFSTTLLSILCFIFGQKEYRFGLKENLPGIIPQPLFSIAFVICVVVTGVWKDFYRFTSGGKKSPYRFCSDNNLRSDLSSGIRTDQGPQQICGKMKIHCRKNP